MGGLAPTQFHNIAGVDEAGRGALAGPVVAAALVFTDQIDQSPFKDSKSLTALKRAELYQQLVDSGSIIGVGVVSHKIIDQINILNATMLAMQRAVKKLTIIPDEVWVDGNRAPSFGGIQTNTIVKGDQIHPVISAASIVAKYTRDMMMIKLHDRFPNYQLNEHKGYGCKAHYDAIFSYGVLPIHRKSFNLTRQEKLF